jgi:molecular chaperone HscB
MGEHTVQGGGVNSSGSGADAFSVLGLPRRFDVDSAELDRAYLRRAAQAHPDISGLSDEESQRQQAALNDARAELADAERRANLLLSLLGGPTKERDKSLPPGFLVEILETREEIEAALATREPAARTRWTAWAAEQRAGYVARVTPLFARASAGDASTLPEIRRELNAWRYIERLVEQLDPAYDPAKADFER